MGRFLVIVVLPFLVCAADGNQPPTTLTVEADSRGNAYPAAEAPILTTRLVKYQAFEQVPLEASIFFPKEESGFRLDYLVTGEGLVGLKGKFVINSIKTAAGQTIPLEVDGRRTWSAFHVNKLTETHRHAAFSIRSTHNSFGNIEGMVVDGTVVALIGRDLQSEEQDIDLATTIRTVIGNYVCRVYQEAEANALSLERDRFHILIEGPMDQLDQLIAQNNNVVIRRYGSRHSNNARYSFARPASGKVKLICKYWKSIAEVTVPIGK